MTDATTAKMVAVALAESEPVQIDLFADPETEGGMRRASQGRGVRGPGRRTVIGERRLEWLRRTYQDPVEGMLAIAQANPADLAALWQCDILEVVQLQAVSRRDAAPYLRSKQPLAVSIDGKTAVRIVIVESDDELGDAAIDITPQVVKIQSLSETASGAAGAESVQAEKDDAKNG